MDTHVHVLLVTLERDVELILMSVLQLLVSMETALYVIYRVSWIISMFFFIRILSMATNAPVIMDGVEKTVMLTLMIVIPTLVNMKDSAL